MKKNNLLWRFITFIIAAIMIPTSVFADDNTIDQSNIDEKRILQSPWEESKDLYFILEEDLQEERNKISADKEVNDDNVLYGEESLELFEELKKQNEEAEDNFFYNNTLVDDNLIEPLSSKGSYRTKFKALALLMGQPQVALPIAGNFLYHSLQDNSSNRTFQTTHSYANSFSRTEVYTDISVKMAKKIDEADKKGEMGVGESRLSDTASLSKGGPDWYLAVNKFSYDWAAEKQKNGDWIVYIGIHDTYNFENIKNADSQYFKAVQLVNNDAVKAQEAGAIVPYLVDIFREQTYRP